MSMLIKMLPLMAALTAAPAFAAEPDPHAGHHPAGAAVTAAPAEKDVAKPDQAKSCPMMDSKMMRGQMGAAGVGGGASGPMKGQGGMASMDHGTMMDGEGMHCMHAPPAAAAEPAPDHNHPKK